MRVDCVIRHEGGNWIASGELFTVASPTLEGIDAKVGESLRRNGVVGRGEKAEVFMAFDNSTIPQWIRQYAQHYFNRIVEVSG